MAILGQVLYRHIMEATPEGDISWYQARYHAVTTAIACGSAVLLGPSNAPPLPAPASDSTLEPAGPTGIQGGGDGDAPRSIKVLGYNVAGAANIGKAVTTGGNAGADVLAVSEAGRPTSAFLPATPGDRWRLESASRAGKRGGGVALLSRSPMTNVTRLVRDGAEAICATVLGWRVAAVYLAPRAGDPAVHEVFGWLDEVEAEAVYGDFNAPLASWAEQFKTPPHHAGPDPQSRAVEDAAAVSWDVLQPGAYTWRRLSSGNTSLLDIGLGRRSAGVRGEATVLDAMADQGDHLPVVFDFTTSAPPADSTVTTQLPPARAWRASRHQPGENRRKFVDALQQLMPRMRSWTELLRSTLQAAADTLVGSFTGGGATPREREPPTDAQLRRWGASNPFRVVKELRAAEAPPASLKDSAASPAEEAEVFREVFSGMAKPGRPPPPKGDEPPLTVLPAFTAADVRASVQAHNTTAGPDEHGLTPALLRLAASAPAWNLAFSRLLWGSVRCSTVPALFRRSVTVPVPKQDLSGPLPPKKFRPVAVTSLLSRTAERIVSEHIWAAIGPRLQESQHGFRKNRGCCSALIGLIQSTLDAWNSPSTKNHEGAVLLIDFAGAFASVKQRACLSPGNPLPMCSPL